MTEAVLRRAILSLEATDAPDSSDLADACYELATLLAAQGKAAEAAKYYERALATRQQLLGPGHPLVATTLHNLALVREAAGQVEEARLLWSRARVLLESPREGEPDADEAKYPSSH